ncbi:hypothetical protein GCM10022403_031050 [Streptomyces coacervatus]|uniref:Secreted protein n=1 Tax=Streptomyces coacervatus TaxID=647381 RepID=A0ABP7HHF9_9ACTN|nr:hypothetical protein [Streptomyces coacervatus]MDF2271402.1 hypothetical protein [Streptomyces coacervatus]
MRKWLPALALSAASISSVLAAPQALAQDSPSAALDLQTRALAAADPAAVRAGVTLCGSGYKLATAEPLPDSRRFGTLFTYIKEVTAPAKSGACAVFDNNLGARKHMKLKLCSSTCKADEGNFSNYAGPVKIESNDSGFQPRCVMVTALMWEGDVAIINRERHVDACD